MKSKFILSLLSILGFTGCEIISSDMYGTPLADYIYTGNVTDAEGNPIQGIQVKVTSDAIVSTDENGAFSATLEGYSYPTSSITFSDIDGEENGGEFASKEVNLDYTNYEDTGLTSTCDLGTIELEAKSEE